MIYLLFAIFIGLVVLHVVTRYDRRGRLLRHLPGPTAYPIFGNTLAFFTTDLHKFWNAGRAVTQKFYPISRLWAFTFPVVFINHPDDVEILLTTHKAITKGYVYDYLKPWLKTGLLTSTGTKWKQRRKMLTPAFHFNILKKYMEINDKEGQKFMQVLNSKGDETVHELTALCSDYTLNVICESAMGVSLDSIESKKCMDYKQAVHNFGNVVLHRVPRPYLTDWMLPLVYGIGEKFRKSTKVLQDFTRMVIKDRKEYHESTQYKFLDNMDNTQKWNLIDDQTGSKKRMAMLDLLLVAHRAGLIDDEGIQEEVDTFTFEGHDTTGIAMAYTLFLLAENEEAQNQARLEVTELLNRKSNELDMVDLQELNYLERCIKESLRLYPPVATILRKTDEDLQLKHGLVPKNTDIMVHLYDTHRDPNFWSEPNKFDPDRFLPENSENRHPFAFVPFSAGPRNCIGQKFAMMELKSLIGRILYEFILEPIDRISDLKLMADIIIRPTEPIRLKFIKIKK